MDKAIYTILSKAPLTKADGQRGLIQDEDIDHFKTNI